MYIAFNSAMNGSAAGVLFPFEEFFAAGGSEEFSIIGGGKTNGVVVFVIDE
jgi:hypothetical protein